MAKPEEVVTVSPLSGITWGIYGSERPGAVPLILRQTFLDAFRSGMLHAAQPHAGASGTLLSSYP